MTTRARRRDSRAAWPLFLACRRGAVALEGVLASIPLVFTLAGVFDVVNTVFLDDLLQRAAHRIARVNALHDSAASNAADMQTRVVDAIDYELGDLLNFQLANKDGVCEPPAEGEDQADYCLTIHVDVYDCPITMKAGTKSKRDSATLGGEAGDMVVVRLSLKSQSALSEVQQRLFGESGIRALAVIRNEREQDLST